jgi:hypothetical protein
MTTLATNLTRGVLMWRWGSTREGVVNGDLGFVVEADSLGKKKSYDTGCVEIGAEIG